jgi:hypothetical protein
MQELNSPTCNTGNLSGPSEPDDSGRFSVQAGAILILELYLHVIIDYYGKSNLFHINQACPDFAHSFFRVCQGKRMQQIIG